MAHQRFQPAGMAGSQCALQRFLPAVEGDEAAAGGCPEPGKPRNCRVAGRLAGTADPRQEGDEGQERRRRDQWNQVQEITVSLIGLGMLRMGPIRQGIAKLVNGQSAGGLMSTAALARQALEITARC